MPFLDDDFESPEELLFMIVGLVFNKLMGKDRDSSIKETVRSKLHLETPNPHIDALVDNMDVYFESAIEDIQSLQLDETSWPSSASHIVKPFPSSDDLLFPLDSIFGNHPVTKKETKSVTSDDPIAVQEKTQLQAKYDIQIILLDTDAEFYSENAFERMVKENIYFLSKESPGKTAEFTEYLAKYNQARGRELLNNPDAVANPIDLRDRAKMLLKEANKKRIEEATGESAKIGEQISAISKEYREANNGKEPSLTRIADTLNERNITPPRGDKWYASGIKRIIEKHSITR